MRYTTKKQQDKQTRAFLLSEIDRISRKERTPNEAMIARFVECKTAQKASLAVTRALSTNRHNDDPIPTPTALLPWLQ